MGVVGFYQYEYTENIMFSSDCLDYYMHNSVLWNFMSWGKYHIKYTNNPIPFPTMVPGGRKPVYLVNPFMHIGLAS